MFNLSQAINTFTLTSGKGHFHGISMGSVTFKPAVSTKRWSFNQDS